MWMQKLQLVTDTDPQWVRTWPERMAGAGDAVWFYLGKLVWPHPLITVYPRWKIDAGEWISYMPLLAVIVVLFILWLKRDSWSRPWFFVFTYFLAALLPVLGLVDNTIFRYSLVFDHLQYLASMGPLALAGAGIVRLSDFVIPEKLWLRIALCAGLLLTLGLLSWQRAWAYESEETLWTDALAKNPNCWVGYNNLGIALCQNGQADEAKAQFKTALELNPNYADAYYNLGLALVQKRRVDEAIAYYQKALEINPSLPGVHNNLGNALFQEERVDEAMAQYQKAFGINPVEANAFINLGLAKEVQGDLDGALLNFRRFGELAPHATNADYAHLWIWIIRARQNQKEQADQELDACLSKSWNASLKDWVTKNAAFLLNRMSEGEYLAAAGSADAKTDRDQHCEAWYYAGMKRLLANDRLAASDDFHKCLATGKADFAEFWLAGAELKALASSH